MDKTQRKKIEFEREDEQKKKKKLIRKKRRILKTSPLGEQKKKKPFYNCRESPSLGLFQKWNKNKEEEIKTTQKEKQTKKHHLAQTAPNFW